MNEPEPIITTEQMAALLGRALTSQEIDNYNLYLDIATERIEGVLGGALPAPLPSDLKVVLAQAFSLNSAEQKAGASTSGGGIVSGKKVEDFSISYDTEAGGLWKNFLAQYGSVLSRYQMRGRMRISGRSCDCI